MANDVEDPLFLPAFANDENKALSAEIKRLQEHLGTTGSSLLDNTDTISVLHEHLGRIQRDVKLASQKLLDLSQGFDKNEHSHQLDLRNLVSLRLSDLTITTRLPFGPTCPRPRPQSFQTMSILRFYNRSPSWGSCPLQKWMDFWWIARLLFDTKIIESLLLHMHLMEGNQDWKSRCDCQ